MTANSEAFMPMTATQTIPASTISVRVLVDQQGANGDHLMVYNASSAPAFIAVGGSSVVAGLTNYPVAPGKEIVRFGDKFTHVAALLTTGTGSIYVCKGQGI